MSQPMPETPPTVTHVNGGAPQQMDCGIKCCGEPGCTSPGEGC